MQKTISNLLLLMIITGTIFVGCAKNDSVDVNGENQTESASVSEGEVSGAAVSGVEGAAMSGEVLSSAATKKITSAAAVKKTTASGAVKATPSAGATVSAQPSAAKTTPSASATVSAQPSAVQPSAQEPVVTAKYKDGTYTRNGGYGSPAGAESITVTVTLQDDVVKSVSVSPNATNDTAKGFQGLFVSGINSLVVGKNIDQIGTFAQVNGSSLTPKGFAGAIASIRSSAKS